MKKILTGIIIYILALMCVFTSYAADGKVTYSGNAGSFVFEPGSDKSLTDLFPDFKGVMPGDVLIENITVRNDADKNVKVKLYIRSLGAHEDSAEFLSQLQLSVLKSEENEMAYMFDAAANETAQLTDWVYLGTLYSGGEVNLDVILSVPVEMGNEFQNQIGFLDWEFKIEELPVEKDDPKAPQTGDNTNTSLWFALAICSATLFIFLLFRRRKENETEEN